MSDSLKGEKRRIRTLIRSSRAARSPEAIAASEVAIGLRLRELVEEVGARSVSCFMSTPREPGTMSFLAWAAEAGIEVLLPSSREDGLLDWIRPSGNDSSLIVGAFGITEPEGERLPPQSVGAVDLVIAPAAAADRSGVRIGWGRGYFDKTLALLGELPPIVAVVFDDELFHTLPSESHDIRMNGVVTPSETLRIDGW